MRTFVQTFVAIMLAVMAFAGALWLIVTRRKAKDPTQKTGWRARLGLAILAFGGLITLRLYQPSQTRIMCYAPRIDPTRHIHVWPLDRQTAIKAIWMSLDPNRTEDLKNELQLLKAAYGKLGFSDSLMLLAYRELSKSHSLTENQARTFQQVLNTLLFETRNRLQFLQQSPMRREVIRDCEHALQSCLKLLDLSQKYNDLQGQTYLNRQLEGVDEGFWKGTHRIHGQLTITLTWEKQRAICHLFNFDNRNKNMINILTNLILDLISSQPTPEWGILSPPCLNELADFNDLPYDKQFLIQSIWKSHDKNAINRLKNELYLLKEEGFKIGISEDSLVNIFSIFTEQPTISSTLLGKWVARLRMESLKHLRNLGKSPGDERLKQRCLLSLSRLNEILERRKRGVDPIAQVQHKKDLIEINEKFPVQKAEKTLYELEFAGPAPEDLALWIKRREDETDPEHRHWSDLKRQSDESRRLAEFIMQICTSKAAPPKGKP